MSLFNFPLSDSGFLPKPGSNHPPQPRRNAHNQPRSDAHTEPCGATHVHAKPQNTSCAHTEPHSAAYAEPSGGNTRTNAKPHIAALAADSPASRANATMHSCQASPGNWDKHGAIAQLPDLAQPKPELSGFVSEER